jgi:hypothetical protein
MVASLFSGAPFLGSLLTGGVAVGATFFVLGAGAAPTLTLAEGRRTLDELSPKRAAAWGAMSGAILPVLALLVTVGPRILTQLADSDVLIALLAGIGSYGALGAALAASTVAVAKQAPVGLAPGRRRSGGFAADTRTVRWPDGGTGVWTRVRARAKLR